MVKLCSYSQRPPSGSGGWPHRDFHYIRASADVEIMMIGERTADFTPPGQGLACLPFIIAHPS